MLNRFTQLYEEGLQSALLSVHLVQNSPYLLKTYEVTAQLS